MKFFEIFALFVMVTALGLAFGFILLQSTIGSSAASRRIRQVLVLLPIFWIVAVLAYELLPPLWGDLIFLRLNPALVLVGSLSLPIQYLIRKRRSGACVLYIGRSRMNKMRLVLSGVILAIAALFGITSFFNGEFDLDRMGSLFLFLSMGFLFLYGGMVPLQVTERGFMETSIQPWENIMSYKWENDEVNTLTLTIKRRGFRSPFKHASYLIPPQHKNALDEILRQKIVPEAPEAIPDTL